MIRISKRFLARAKPALRQYQRVLEGARSRDVNESDTVTIVSDLLSSVLGYDKYAEITTEHAIRGTYCDLAVQMKGGIRFLIEVKAIGKDLRDNHLRQATDYGANAGVEWILLTNGVEWQAHRVRFDKPIDHDHVFTIDLLDRELKPADALARLYLLSREACKDDAIDLFHRQGELTSRYVLAQLLLSDKVVKVVRREIRRLAKDVSVTTDDIMERLQVDVLKRDLLEGGHAERAADLVRRSARRRRRQAAEPKPAVKPASPPRSQPVALGTAPVR